MMHPKRSPLLQRSFIDELKELNDELRSRRIRLAMMAVHRPVMEAFERGGFINEIDPIKPFLLA